MFFLMRKEKSLKMTKVGASSFLKLWKCNVFTSLQTNLKSNCQERLVDFDPLDLTTALTSTVFLKLTGRGFSPTSS